MSKPNKKQESFDAGMFIMPLMDLINFLIEGLIKLLVRLTEKGLDKYLFKKEIKTTKIEKSHLNIRKSTTSFDSLGYSVTQKRDFKSSELNSKVHSLVVGASGFGKTILLESLVFADMRQGKNVIFIDPKGDNETMERFIDLCRLNNKEYGIFAKNYKGKYKIKLNPSKAGNYTEISNRIFRSFIWSEEHYANKSFQGLKRAVKQIEGVVTLERILAKIIELTKLSKSNEDYLDHKMVDGIITRLENIVDSDYGDRIKGSDAFSFSELRSSGKCIYIALPTLGKAETSGVLGKLLLNDVAHSVNEIYETKPYRESSSIKPLGLYVDELSSFFTEDYVHILSKCRGANLELTSLIQSVSDIDSIDPTLKIPFFESTLNWFIMKQRMQSSCDLLADAIGTIEGAKDTVRIEDGQEQAIGSQRKVEEYIVHPNIIKNLNEGQAILLRQKPSRIDLLNIKYIDQRTIDSNLDYFERYKLIPKREVIKTNTKQGHRKLQRRGIENL